MRTRREGKSDESACAWCTYFTMATLASLPLSAPLLAQRVIFVSEKAAGTNDGSSWVDAYQDLQDALDDARANGDLDAELWIAAGTYKPDRGTGDQTLAFELFGSVALYGGFGGREECRDQRDPGLNVTTLSGDLRGDDALDASPTSDCCDPLLYPLSCSDAQCRAAVVASWPPCDGRWQETCRQVAVAVCCDLCRPTRCDNSYNVLRIVDVTATVPVLDGLDIVDGEGIAGDYGSAGGLYARSAGPRITGSRFLRNGMNAAYFYSPSGTLSLEGTSFVDNGIGLLPNYAVYIDDAPDGLTINHVRVSNNVGSGMLILGGTVTLRDCTFADNRGTGLDCSVANCTVVNSRFIGNKWGGMFSYNLVQVIDSLFLGNSDQGLFTYSGAVIVNSIFAENTGGFAAGLECSSAYVLNSLFFGNSSDYVGGMSVDGGTTIRNSIFWGNSDAGGFTQSAQFSTYSTTTIHVDHSVVQGWTGSWGGVGNSGVDPMFVDPVGPDGIIGTEDDDLRLSPGSPAINAGDPNTTYLPPTDLDGHARILCARVDIGPYEFGIGDYNCDQSVDLSDFANWSACMTGPQAPVAGAPGSDSTGSQSTIDNLQSPIPCPAFDFNADGSVDLLDFAGFSRSLNGP